MDLGKYKTDEQRETEGIWVPFDDAEFLIARWGNPKFQRLLDKRTKKHRKQIEMGLLSPEQDRAIMNGVMAETVLLGWKNVSLGGKEVRYSVEEAKRILGQYAPIREFVIAESQRLENFRVAELEAVTENLSSSSAGS